MRVREYMSEDINDMMKIWNEVVEEGNAFPQEEVLSLKTAEEFFAVQNYTGVAVDENGVVKGLYILHPNNVGRCSHIANASYAVDKHTRGKHIGKHLVLDCLQKAKEKGFLILQFNAVVESNVQARRLYEHIGFQQLGTIPKGFRKKNGVYENICPYFIVL